MRYIAISKTVRDLVRGNANMEHAVLLQTRAGERVQLSSPEIRVTHQQTHLIASNKRSFGDGTRVLEAW